MADTESSLPAEPVGGERGTDTPRRLEAVRLGADLRQAAVYQAPLTPEFAAQVVTTIEALMASTKPRQRAAGARLATRLMEYNLSLAEKADKIARLDGGLPTERQEVVRDTGMDVIDMATKDPALMRALLDAVRKPKAPAPDKPA